MTNETVRAAYAARSEEYTALLGSMGAVHPDDQVLVREWAEGVTGPVLDVGCGPGHWTAFLAELGLTARGVDLVPEFVEIARAAHPGVPFDVGTMTALDVPDGGASAILAWYSTIHTPPERMAAVLRELARALAPGGRLLLGFFPGAESAPFAHAVTTAYAWPVDELAARLAVAGFEVTGRWTRTEPDRRPHAALSARRTPL